MWCREISLGLHFRSFLKKSLLPHTISTNEEIHSHKYCAAMEILCRRNQEKKTFHPNWTWLFAAVYVCNCLSSNVYNFHEIWSHKPNINIQLRNEWIFCNFMNNFCLFNFGFTSKTKKQIVSLSRHHRCESESEFSRQYVVFCCGVKVFSMSAFVEFGINYRHTVKCQIDYAHSANTKCKKQRTKKTVESSSETNHQNCKWKTYLRTLWALNSIQFDKQFPQVQRNVKVILSTHGQNNSSVCWSENNHDEIGKLCKSINHLSIIALGNCIFSLIIFGIISINITDEIIPWGWDHVQIHPQIYAWWMSKANHIFM